MATPKTQTANILDIDEGTNYIQVFNWNVPLPPEIKKPGDLLQIHNLSISSKRKIIH